MIKKTQICTGFMGFNVRQTEAKLRPCGARPKRASTASGRSGEDSRGESSESSVGSTEEKMGHGPNKKQVYDCAGRGIEK